MKILIRAAGFRSVATLSLTLVAMSAQAQLYDARSGGRAGTGQTMGDHAYISGNPALLGRSGQGRGGIALNAGVLLSDRDGFIEIVEDAQDDIERIEDGGFSSPAERDAFADRVADKLEELDDKLIQANPGGVLGVGLPGLPAMPMAVAARRSARVGSRFIYDDNDRNAMKQNSFVEDDIQSELSASAVDTTEVALMGARTLTLAGLDDVHVGAAIKFQRISLIDYRRSLPDFEGDDILDDSDNSREHSNLNVDLGVYKSFGMFSGAAMVRNLIPRSFSGPNHEYSMRPEFELAGGVDLGPVQGEAGIDLTPSQGYGDLEDTQFMRIGAEFGARRIGQLRLGYRVDMLDNVAPVLTAGVGLSPMGVVNLDLAVMTGEGDTLGGSVQLGVNF